MKMDVYFLEYFIMIHTPHMGFPSTPAHGLIKLRFGKEQKEIHSNKAFRKKKNLSFEERFLGTDLVTGWKVFDLKSMYMAMNDW